MKNNENISQKFINDYITRCRSADQPLTKGQISLLEQVVDHCSKNAASNSIGLDSNMDEFLDTATMRAISSDCRYRRPQRLINAIKEFKYDTTGIQCDATDADAMELYLFVTEKVRDLNISEIKKKYKFPRGFGLKALSILHCYLQNKGYIDKTKPVPREPRYQNI